MKKFFKIFAIVSVCFSFLIISFLIYFFNKLPSAQQIGKSLSRPTTNAQPAVVSRGEDAPAVEVTTAGDEVPATEALSQIEAEKTQRRNDLLEDLTSPEKPLSDFCGSLKNANASTFSSKELDGAYNESLNPDTQDPRVQATKPLLRFAMRLPRFSELINDVKSAMENSDESSENIFKKAELYAKALSVYSEIREHKKDLESILDRSYLFVGLNKLIAAKPELLNDSRVRSFCSDVETSFNQFSPVLFDEEKNKFLNLLSDMNVEPKQIGFDPNYKSNIDFQITNRSLIIEGGWLEDLVHPDPAL